MLIGVGAGVVRGGGVENPQPADIFIFYFYTSKNYQLFQFSKIGQVAEIRRET